MAGTYQDTDPLGGLGTLLFGGSKTQTLSTLTGGQEALLNTMTTGGKGAVNSLYGTLGGLSANNVSAYDALPDFENTFNQQFGNPLRQQYEKDLANIQNSSELFSGGTTANNYRAMNNLNTNMASARANMMMQEREKQRQSEESSLQRQLQASQLLANLGTAGMNVKGIENVTSKTPGLLSAISGIGSAVGSVAQGLSGLGAS